MKSATINRIASAVGLPPTVPPVAGSPEAYPPPANPFLSGATPLQNITLAQPAKFGLVWLVPAGSAVPSQEAQRKMAEKIKGQFTAGKRLEITGTTILPVSQGDLLNDIRKASAPLNVPEVLVVMPNGIEVVSLEWFFYGGEGSAVSTRTDIFMTVSLVGLDLTSGKSLFFVAANGEARLLAPNYEDARPLFPNITPGRPSNFIYPDAATFPPGAVQAVALEDAVNGLIYELGKALGS